MHAHSTLQQALLLLRDRGDKPLSMFNGKKMRPRPSDVLKAMNSNRGVALHVHDDVDDEDEMLELLPVTESAEDVALSRLPDDYTELHRAVRELSPRQRDVIEMMYWRGLDLRQASDTMRCTYENARQHHVKALKTLRGKINARAI